MMKLVELLPLDRNYIKEILEIEKASFPEPWTPEMFERELSLAISRFFVAVAEGRVVGYGGFWQIHDEAHIVNLAVHPQWRSRGIGRKILTYLLETSSAQGLAKIFLEVRTSNVKAQRLYGSMGFKTTGVRPRYYNNAEDALLMEKELAGRPVR